jgi:cytoskeletal protein RodZ
MDNLNNISDTLEEIMREKHVSVEKLADATDIPKRFITSLMEGRPEQLPARPYVRGYLFKIAEALQVDPHTLWQSYRISTEISSSGDKDKLPSNRFAYKKIAASRVAGILLLLVVLVFIGFRFNEILGRPTLDVSVPDTTTEETITVSGNVAPGDRLTLNGEVVYPNEEGYFEKRVQLEPNLNTLTFTVKKYLGKETTVVKQVFYQPTQQSEPEEQSAQ